MKSFPTLSFSNWQLLTTCSIFSLWCFLLCRKLSSRVVITTKVPIIYSYEFLSLIENIRTRLKPTKLTVCVHGSPFFFFALQVPRSRASPIIKIFWGWSIDKHTCRKEVEWELKAVENMIFYHVEWIKEWLVWVKKSVSRDLKSVPYKIVLEMGDVEDIFSSLSISILSCVFAIKILILFWLAKAEHNESYVQFSQHSLHIAMVMWLYSFQPTRPKLGLVQKLLGKLLFYW